MNASQRKLGNNAVVPCMPALSGIRKTRGDAMIIRLDQEL
jgi:hypothetical protein